MCLLVDHMFKPTREVYGQKARDLSNRVLDWHDYGIDLKKRPSPYDFPAFERDERITENRQTTTTQEVSGKQRKSHLRCFITQFLDGQANEKQTEAAKNATVGASGKDVTDSKGPAKNPDGIGSKKESAFKRNRRLSHNREMDECSLEGN
jgi:hypothetical protein